MRGLVLTCFVVAAVAATAQSPSSKGTVASFYDLKTSYLDGKPADLAVFRGKVSLVVNVASQCAFTPQYEGLEALHRELSGKGFSVLGFPGFPSNAPRQTAFRGNPENGNAL